MTAQLVRFGIWGVSAVLALLAFLHTDGLWAFAAFFVVMLVGSILSRLAFKRLATPEERLQDLRDRADSTD